MAKATLALVCFRAVNWINGSGSINYGEQVFWHFFFITPYLRRMLPGKNFGIRERLFRRISSICVHEQLHFAADGFPRGTDALFVASGIAADFHFDHLESVLGPAVHLVI